jgi:cytochrome c oxidase subunit 3
VSEPSTIAADAGHASADHAHQFEDLPQQREADTLGMWLFLATEVMLFGGLFAAYTMYRLAFYQDFAQASHELNLWAGTLNTVVLLTSSFFVVLAVQGARKGRSAAVFVWLLLTLVLGAAFLGVKAYEYHADWEEHLVPFFGRWDLNLSPQMRLFFVFYFIMTGLHALHMVAGMIAVGIVARMAAQGRFTKPGPMHVEMVGLYWHFVDIVWVFLLPTLYMVAPHQWKGF